jgi:hypothetical protein
LTPHNSGQWCKKIRGEVRFFGIWEEPEAALENYLRVAADLHGGREPRSSTISADGVTVKQLCNHHLTYQHRRSQAGEIGPHCFSDGLRRLQLRSRPVVLIGGLSGHPPPSWRLWPETEGR